MDKIETKWAALRTGGAAAVDGYLLGIIINEKLIMQLSEAEAGALLNQISHSLDIPVHARGV